MSAGAAVTLALTDHVPRSARRGAHGWAGAGEDPDFDLPELARVATADALMEAARRLREPYLEAIGRLAALNDSPEWWAGHLAAKHPYPDLFARLCGVAALAALAREGALPPGTLIACATPAQLAALHALIPGARVAPTAAAQMRRRAPSAVLDATWPALRAFGRSAPGPLRRAIAGAAPPLRFALERTPGHRRRTLEALGAPRLTDFDGGALLVTWLDERSVDARGGFRDPHLGPLAGMLRERGLPVAHLGKALLHAPFADVSARVIASGAPVAFPDLYLTAADWHDCERRVRSYAPTIPPDLAVEEVPFAGLAREYDSEHRRAQVDALTHEPLAANLAAAGVRPSVLVFPWEGHAWEQSLIAGVRRHLPDTTVIAYDNLNFSSLALSLYPAPEETAIRPLPDRIVTNGPTFAARLRASAFPDGRIAIGCALRHAHIHDTEPRPRDERFVLAACSIDASQSIELLRKAREAFGDDLVVRLHPASDMRAIRDALPDLRYSGQPLTELLPHARLMLYTYSVVPYEALAAGTPPVFVRSDSRLDLDQLDPTPDVRWVGRTPDELRVAAAAIGAMPDRAGWERRAREVVRAALAPISPDCVERFLP